jgi:hypothetical protein
MAGGGTRHGDRSLSAPGALSTACGGAGGEGGETAAGRVPLRWVGDRIDSVRAAASGIGPARRLDWLICPRTRDRPYGLSEMDAV